MNRDEVFELQLAGWLEEGPLAAPPEPVAAALAHVRAHPRRPLAYGNPWRRAVSGIPLTHVPSRPGRAWPAIAAAIAVVAVVGVGAYGLFGRGGTGAPGPGASPTAITSPTPGATDAAATATGTTSVAETCRASTPPITTTVDEVVQTRGEGLTCSHTSVDPRLAGDADIVVNSDEHPEGLYLGWGTIEVRNDHGTWTGTFAFRSTAGATRLEFDAVWFGSGDYAGLEVVNHVRSTGSSASITSRIFDAGSTVAGVEVCTTTDVGATAGSGDITSYRGVAMTCVDTMADTQLSGTRTLDFSIDVRPDDSADLWGITTLDNAEGAWEGVFVGTVDPGYTIHHAQSLMRGSGAYDGFLYRLDVVGTPDDGFELTGEIIRAA